MQAHLRHQAHRPDLKERIGASVATGMEHAGDAGEVPGKPSVFTTSYAVGAAERSFTNFAFD
jgi:hypothetical protein